MQQLVMYNEEGDERTVVELLDDGSLNIYYQHNIRGPDTWTTWQDSGAGLSAEQVTKLRELLNREPV